MKTIKFLSLLLVLLFVLSMPIYADMLSGNDICGHDCAEHEHDEEGAEVISFHEENGSSENSFSESEKKIKTIFGLMTQAEIDAYNAKFMAEAEAKKEAQRLADEEKILTAKGFTGLSVIEFNGVKVMTADYTASNLALIQDSARKAAILRAVNAAEQKSYNACTHPNWVDFWIMSKQNTREPWKLLS